MRDDVRCRILNVFRSNVILFCIMHARHSVQANRQCSPLAIHHHHYLNYDSRWSRLHFSLHFLGLALHLARHFTGLALGLSSQLAGLSLCLTQRFVGIGLDLAFVRTDGFLGLVDDDLCR
jgi:hypothetical protein